MDGIYRSESGHIPYEVEFTIDGDTVSWNGRARLPGGDWIRIAGGPDAIHDVSLVDLEVHALVGAAIEERLSGEAA